MRYLFLSVLCASLAFGQSNIRRYQVEFKHDSTATAYAAGDAVVSRDSLPTLLVGQYDYDAGTIIAAKLSADTANVANANFRLLLFSDSLNLARPADDAAFTVNKLKDSLLVGYIDFTLIKPDSAANTLAFDLNTGTTGGLPIPFALTKRSRITRGLWGVLICQDAYVPKHAGSFRITLWITATP